MVEGAPPGHAGSGDLHRQLPVHQWCVRRGGTARPRLRRPSAVPALRATWYGTSQPSEHERRWGECAPFKIRASRPKGDPSVKGLAASAGGALTDQPPVAWFGLVGPESSAVGALGVSALLHVLSAIVLR